MKIRGANLEDYSDPDPELNRFAEGGVAPLPVAIESGYVAHAVFISMES
jgi:hypothetical protein